MRVDGEAAKHPLTFKHEIMSYYNDTIQLVNLHFDHKYHEAADKLKRVNNNLTVSSFSGKLSLNRTDPKAMEKFREVAKKRYLNNFWLPEELYFSYLRDDEYNINTYGYGYNSSVIRDEYEVGNYQPYLTFYHGINVTKKVVEEDDGTETKASEEEIKEEIHCSCQNRKNCICNDFGDTYLVSTVKVRAKCKACNTETWIENASYYNFPCE
jgi:hypothetical protein